MKWIKYSFVALIVVISACWWLAEPGPRGAYTFFALRSVLVNYTGVLGIAVMSVAMLLALRPRLPESRLGGLDKMYRLHNWLGIAGFVLALSHWLWVKAPKWMVGWGWLTRPARKPPTASLDPWLQLLQSQRGLAKSLGEWAFYALVALLLVALIKRFPYRHSFKLHRLMPVVYLLLVFHSFILIPMVYWRGIIGPLLAVLMLAGSVAAVRSLIGGVGRGRRVTARVLSAEQQSTNQVLELEIQLDANWPGHQAGQFAFLRFAHDPEAHPFTIASAWQGDGRMAFMIKASGDFTRQLATRLQPGSELQVEGPYGRFDFASEKPRQIWVAGGVGITPFIARMQALAHGGEGKPIDLFYSARALPEQTRLQLKYLARSARVRLHLLRSGVDPRLDSARICAAVPEWNHADLWFCGPNEFGQALRRDMRGQGMHARDFHQELFEMR